MGVERPPLRTFSLTGRSVDLATVMGTRSLVLISAYIGVQILSDITSLKIVVLAGLVFDAGTLVYPVTFTLRDLVHRSLGMSAARVLIVTAAALNLLMAGLFWLVGQLPADVSTGDPRAFAALLSPVWRIVLASIVAEVLSEFLDTEVYHRWVLRIGTRHAWSRVVVSNAISIPVDSVLFVLLAFAGRFDAPVIVAIITSNILLKYVVTVVSIPLIYTVPEGSAHTPEGRP